MIQLLPADAALTVEQWPPEDIYKTAAYVCYGEYTDAAAANSLFEASISIKLMPCDCEDKYAECFY